MGSDALVNRTDQVPTLTMWQETLSPTESESRSVVSDSATPLTVQSMEFSRPEYWSGEPFPSPGDLPNPGIKSRSPALQVDPLAEL